MPSGFILSTKLWVEREPGSDHTSNDAVVSSPCWQGPRGAPEFCCGERSVKAETDTCDGGNGRGREALRGEGGWRPSLQVGICLCVKTVPRQGLA